MIIDNMPLDLIDEKVLQSLVDDRIEERKMIEYKEASCGRSDHDVKEFLADVSSFANASGGHLILGIKAEDGVPKELCGLELDNPEEEILRIENKIRDGIKPRIPGIQTRYCILSSKRVIIIIRIPKSLASPHMITFQNWSRFYSRQSAGKYQLDVEEIRLQFLHSSAIGEQINIFRKERLGNIISGETPMPLDERPVIVFHIIPIDVYNANIQYDIGSLQRGEININPMFSSGWNEWYNYDGIVTYAGPPDSATQRGYLQIFRNGSIEAVTTSMINVSETEKTIDILTLERELIASLKRFLRIQKFLGVMPPILLMLSILRIKGFHLSVPRHFYSGMTHSIEKQDLISPEIQIDSFDVDHARVLQPLFNLIWNACGWPRSLSYTEDGDLKPSD